jgi:hypothetical protein
MIPLAASGAAERRKQMALGEILLPDQGRRFSFKRKVDRAKRFVTWVVQA